MYKMKWPIKITSKIGHTFVSTYSLFTIDTYQNLYFLFKRFLNTYLPISCSSAFPFKFPLKFYLKWYPYILLLVQIFFKIYPSLKSFPMSIKQAIPILTSNSLRETKKVSDGFVLDIFPVAFQSG